MNLSKSKYTRFCQCPKMLWLDKYKPELAKVDETLLKRFEEGNEVGDLAMGLLGDYIEVTTQNADGSLNIPAMLAKTKKLVAVGAANICEAAFSAEGCYCAVDILHRTEGGYAIYEVKSSTEIKDVYLCDVAYQKWVLENAGVRITGTYIAYINNQYVRHGEVDIHALFNIEDVSAKITPFYSLVAANVEKAKAYLKQTEEPEMSIAAHCKNPYVCSYWEYCSRNIPRPSVFDLYRIGFENACEYYNNGIVTFDDVLNSGINLTEKQLTQVEHGVKDLPAHVDTVGIREFLNTLHYPLYFLDFETFQTCVPLYDVVKPFQQIPFQYSLHYITGVTEKLEHKEFLADENSDPRRALAERLVEDIPLNACVLAYYKAFECTRLKELAELFPDLADSLLTIKENICDLLDVFRGGYVYNRAMGGSFSIKSVLPAMFPDNPALNYHNLQDVHNGTEATNAFLSLPKLSVEERSNLRKNLLLYCGLDTYAMVVLWQKLVEISLE